MIVRVECNDAYYLTTTTNSNSYDCSLQNDVKNCPTTSGGTPTVDVVKHKSTAKRFSRHNVAMNAIMNIAAQNTSTGGDPIRQVKDHKMRTLKLLILYWSDEVSIDLFI